MRRALRYLICFALLGAVLAVLLVWNISAGSVYFAPGEILSALLLQYYGGRSALPREIYLPVEIEDQEVLEQLLTEKAGHRVVLRVPQRGERAQALAMAETNAREEAERQTTAQERTDRTLELLGRLMGCLLYTSDAADD